MSYEVTRRLEWDMAHRIPLHGGRCQHLHGHRYAAEITCTARELNKQGFVIDFGLIKELVGAWVDRHWDHNTCYQAGDKFMEALERAALEAWKGPGGRRVWYPLEKAPTAENLAEKLHEVATELLERVGIEVVRVDLWETPNCRARFEPEQNPSYSMSEEDYNDIAGAPSFKDPSIFGIKKLLEKQKKDPLDEKEDELGWEREEGRESRPVELEDRDLPGTKFFLPDPFEVAPEEDDE